MGLTADSANFINRYRLAKHPVEARHSLRELTRQSNPEQTGTRKANNDKALDNTCLAAFLLIAWHSIASWNGDGHVHTG